jgi:hypothetical protein
MFIDPSKNLKFCAPFGARCFRQMVSDTFRSAGARTHLLEVARSINIRSLRDRKAPFLSWFLFIPASEGRLKY